ncbi:MAG TPA: S1/P1 nuclease, partial [Chthoniobacterales bacterium]
MMRARYAWSVALLALSISTVGAYGPLGHEIVGAIADQKLAKTSTAQKIAGLLEGISLERAATIADEIKSWDKNGPGDAKAYPHFPNAPRLDAQLRDFWRANQPTHDLNSAMPSHHWFHYTDVPVSGSEKYADGKSGRTKWDIVHMMNFCIGVLQGDQPEDNARKITKPIAVVLLVHFAGDIHQPLHVGAEYFDGQGHVVNPDEGADALDDEGGNSLTLNLTSNGAAAAARPPRFHGFWDSDAVLANFPPLPETMTKEEKYARTEE